MRYKYNIEFNEFYIYMLYEFVMNIKRKGKKWNKYNDIFEKIKKCYKNYKNRIIFSKEEVKLYISFLVEMSELDSKTYIIVSGVCRQLLEEFVKNNVINNYYQKTKVNTKIPVSKHTIL